MVGREDKRTNNRTILSTLKYNAAAGYQGPVKIELLKGAGLLVTALIPTAYLRALVSHTFVFVYMREFGYYILFGACRNEQNHCETTKDNET